MANYYTQPNGTKEISLIQENELVGKLHFNNALESKASILLPDNSIYTITPLSFWKNTLVLKDNPDNVLASIKMSWKNGNIIIRSKLDNEEKEFVFTPKKTFKGIYALVGNKGEELLTIECHFKWNRFNYDYKITTNDNVFGKFGNPDILLFIAIYCTNYYITSITIIIA